MNKSTKTPFRTRERIAKDLKEVEKMLTLVKEGHSLYPQLTAKRAALAQELRDFMIKPMKARKV